MSGKIPVEVAERSENLVSQGVKVKSSASIPGSDSVHARAVDTASLSPVNPTLAFTDVEALVDEHEKSRIERAFAAASFQEMTHPESPEAYKVRDAQDLYEYLFPNRYNRVALLFRSYNEYLFLF